MGYLPVDLDFEYGELTDLLMTFNAAIRRVRNKNPVLVIDLEKTVPHGPEYLYDAIHFPDNGSRCVAEIIVDALTKEALASPRGQGVRRGSGSARHRLNAIG